LNPHVILCAASWSGFTNVHVSTPKLLGAFSAKALDIKLTTTQITIVYRMAAFLFAARCTTAIPITASCSRTRQLTNPTCAPEVMRLRTTGFSCGINPLSCRIIVRYSFPLRNLL
jgi:hypothetical protein